MSEMKNFKIDFVKRTIFILNNHYKDEKYEVTLLLNCLLALVSLPIELKKDEYDKKIKQYKKDCVSKLTSLSNFANYNKTTYNTRFRNIRNAIAHLNIEPITSNKKIESITLRNINNDGIMNFEVNISIENLKMFAEYVANEYIKL